MMAILLIAVVYIVAFAVSTAIFGFSLYVVEDAPQSSFRNDGRGITWAKCAGLVVATTLLGLVPFGALLALVVWFVGIMALFQKSLWEAFLLLVTNGLFSWGIGWLIGTVLEALVSTT
jgi:hypothetical protein